MFNLERPTLNSESIREQASNVQHRMADSVKPRTAADAALARRRQTAKIP